MSELQVEQGKYADISGSSVSSRIVSRLIVWVGVRTWRAQVDWGTRRPMLVRTTAHLSIILLALAALAIGGIEPLGQVFGAGAPIQATLDTAEDVPTPATSYAWSSSASSVLDRQVLPHTTIPERPRSSVVTYTVQPGDTVFGIAESFGLSPHTIYWANSDVLHDNPHMLWPDMVLNILPVNGVYHIVDDGETISTIASDYGVGSSAIYNEWNGLEQGQSLQAGSALVIAGGTRDFLVWQLPTYSDIAGSASIGSGLCLLPPTGLRGNGWHIWPTDSRRISGWTFHDLRNPPHSGLDTGLRTGDPIYATDNGVVAYAGWNDWGYGYLVVIDHGNNFHTYYAHLSAIWVVCGQSVYQGAAIAGGGSTGRSSGPHLHYEIRYDGIPQDPLYYLP
jgi:LysM repeat protein